MTGLVRHFIDGDFIEGTDETLVNENPATGGKICDVACGGAAEVAQAVAAAKRAERGWQQTPASERAYYLRAFAERIEATFESLAILESEDTGKPFELASNVDIPRSAQNFRFFAERLLQQGSDFFDDRLTGFNYVRREPLGTVACIAPWNLPLYLLTWKIAPALACGNCVIAKPSELTPRTAAILGHIAQEIELPPGVLNILHGRGSEVGQALCEHPEVNAISFTGGTATGKVIAKTVASSLKKVSLELGGKNAAVLFEDCDFEKALTTLTRAAFSNQGEICLCMSRFFIKRSLYKEFQSAFVARVQALNIGPPEAEDTHIGALISAAHLEKVQRYIQGAVAEGGRVLTGGDRVHLDGLNAAGYYLQPTVIADLPHTATINQEEVFGPVVTLAPFDEEDEVVDWVNSTGYGLATSLWTSDLNRMHRLAHQIDTGIVWGNTWMQRDLRTPFGGMKQSGLGREGGSEAMRFFTEAKTVCLDLAGA